MTDLAKYATDTAARARRASRELGAVTGQTKIDWLRRAGELIRSRTADIAIANEKDLAQAPEYGLSDAAVDRLRLTPDRLNGIADALEEIIALPDPVGEIIESNVRPNGLLVTRVRVPLGVVFFIFESRPNVTVDAAALCVKSGNAVILRGGKEAFHSNHALHALLVEALEQTGLPADAVQLVNTTDRAAVGHFLKLHETIDVTIPRGGKGLIERVAAEAAMPVIKHFDGNCHVYVHEKADRDLAERIVVDSKCQRTGVCNAAESLLVDASIAAEMLPRLGRELKQNGVELRVCEQSREFLPECKLATDEDHRTEYLGLVMSVKTVGGLDAAIAHINEYGSHHTESIVTTDVNAAKRFTTLVDSSAVMVNASTRFNDGGEFGLGAEIGISTDKFHARGPCGLRELTSYKYVVHGDGQVKG